jgi:hypothetical protein
MVQFSIRELIPIVTKVVFAVTPNFWIITHWRPAPDIDVFAGIVNDSLYVPAFIMTFFPDNEFDVI